MRFQTVPAAVLTLSLAAAVPVTAQRALVPAMIADRSAMAPASAYAPPPAHVPWDSLTSSQRTNRRILWATGGAVVGLAAGAGMGVALVASDHRPSDIREEDGLAVLGLAAIGSALGVAVAAPSAGGLGHGACRRSVRELRSLLGTVAGTAAVVLLAYQAPTALLAIPAGQVGGAVLALGGC